MSGFNIVKRIRDQMQCSPLEREAADEIEQLEAEPERIARTIVGIKWLGQWDKRMILTELYPPPEDET